MKFCLAVIIVFFTLTSCSNEVRAKSDDDICSETSVKIIELVKVSKYCKQDSDCEFMPIACSMGCPVVNKERVQEIKNILNQRNHCMCTMEACLPPAKIGCVQGTCKAL